MATRHASGAAENVWKTLRAPSTTRLRAELGVDGPFGKSTRDHIYINRKQRRKKKRKNILFREKKKNPDSAATPAPSPFSESRSFSAIIRNSKHGRVELRRTRKTATSKPSKLIFATSYFRKKNFFFSSKSGNWTLRPPTDPPGFDGERANRDEIQDKIIVYRPKKRKNRQHVNRTKTMRLHFVLFFSVLVFFFFLIFSI